MSQFHLEKDGVSLALDDRGRLTTLQTAGRPNLIRSVRPGFWRLFLCRIEDQEIPVLPEDQATPRIEVGADEITLTYPQLRCHLGTLDIALVMRVRIDAGELCWRMTIDNHSDIMVSEAWYPLIGGLADLADNPAAQWLAWPNGAGLRIPDPRRWVRQAHSRYCGADQFEIVAKTHYPYPAGMSWCDLHTENSGLFLACLDDRFRNGFLTAMLESDELTLGYIKHPLIHKGQRWESPPYVVAAHAGDWRWGARRYRRWADTWLQLPTPPAWLTTWFGWQRTILEHQYGEVLWTYNQIEELCRHAQTAGLDTLHILGWWRGGMDRGYPDYDCDDRLGGEAAFRKAIQAVRAAGVRVMPYINGRLLDVTSPYFKEHGARLAARTLIGTEYRENYPFWGRGSLVSGLGRLQVQHGIPCAACEEWWDEVEKIVRQVVDYGTDGILIDQIGGMLDRLCFAEGHGHDRPDEAFTTASNHFLARLRRHIKADHPDFALGTEHFTDMTAQHFDYIHGCGHGFHPGGHAFPALTRYAFPEFIFTNRDGGYDEVAYRQHAGFAMLNGFRFDMSVYRCRGSMADLPEYGRFLPKAQRLHRAVDNLLLAGRYTHDDDYKLDTPALQHAGYVGADGRLAVVAWNPTGEAVACPAPACDRPPESVQNLDGPCPAAATQNLTSEQVTIWVFGRKK
ncbi:MAG: hypothetical protein A3K19_21270 [Lentisphaerae bacterium RIFOXYB12_FULL_65_16]|nr:MAG: hypothetical protein A3K18_33945 [Lentisphaerae bacterium RIFOXYA12_64_32]OGV93663.1 MAG: hypothetical protein A3K19_21270 [Lentisphaerae bacterium RIFOXYB12_FULL_65_16]